MARKKKTDRRRGGNARRSQMTPASLIGIGIGLLMVGVGGYSAVARGEYGAFYIAVLGVCVLAAVCWGTLRKR